MNRALKSSLKITAAVVVLGVFILVAGFWYEMSKACDTEISEAVKSPNGAHEAVAFHVGCGVLSDSLTVTQLSVRRVGEKALESVFAIDDYGALPRERYNDENPRLTMTWVTDNQLRIEFPKGPHTLSRKDSADGIAIEYVQAKE